ncbi:Golgin subfamily A member 4 [Trichinella spiralis]|uniref:Golgin subfamily A member 4 n=1 Tax=Trichinella spiralis TaxID=6334 RepID=A0A0V1B7J8_TRISP|nr:Golgin subfamily A member 4 [Trichinella spiralis]
MCFGKSLQKMTSREIYKAGWVKLAIKDEATSKEEKVIEQWLVFCVHSDRVPLLESYAHPREVMKHVPFKVIDLFDCSYVVRAVVHDRMLTVGFKHDDRQPITLIAVSVEEKEDWIQQLTWKLCDIGCLPCASNVYTVTPLGLKTRQEEVATEGQQIRTILSAVNGGDSSILPSETGDHFQPSDEVPYYESLGQRGNETSQGEEVAAYVAPISSLLEKCNISPECGTDGKNEESISVVNRPVLPPRDSMNRQLTDENSFHLSSQESSKKQFDPDLTDNIYDVPPISWTRHAMLNMPPTDEDKEYKDLNVPKSATLAEYDTMPECTASIGELKSVTTNNAASKADLSSDVASENSNFCSSDCYKSLSPDRRRIKILPFQSKSSQADEAAKVITADELKEKFSSDDSIALLPPIPHSLPPVLPPRSMLSSMRVSLREQETLQLNSEIHSEHPIKFTLSLENILRIAFVNISGFLWISGWQEIQGLVNLRAFVHIGDRLMAIDGRPLDSESQLEECIKRNLDTSRQCEILLKRMPMAKVFLFKRFCDGEDVGLVLKNGKNEIVNVVQDSAAWRAGFRAKTESKLHPHLETTWYITEINGRPINVFLKNGECKQRLSAIGREISVVVQRTDFIKAVKHHMTLKKHYRNFIVVSNDWKFLQILLSSEHQLIITIAADKILLPILSISCVNSSPMLVRSVSAGASFWPRKNYFQQSLNDFNHASDVKNGSISRRNFNAVNQVSQNLPEKIATFSQNASTSVASQYRRFSTYDGISFHRPHRKSRTTCMLYENKPSSNDESNLQCGKIILSSDMDADLVDVPLVSKSVIILVVHCATLCKTVTFLCYCKLVDLFYKGEETKHAAVDQSLNIHRIHQRHDSISSLNSIDSIFFQSYPSSTTQYMLTSDLESIADEESIADAHDFPDPTSRDQLSSLFNRLKGRATNYKEKYKKVAGVYRDVFNENEKLKINLTATQDRAIEKINQLRKKHVDEVGKLQNVVNTLEMRVCELEKIRDEEVAKHKNKVKILEDLLERCKESITGHKSSIESLTLENQSLRDEIENFSHKQDEPDEMGNLVMERVNLDWQRKLKAVEEDWQRKLADMEEKSNMTVAMMKQEMHEAIQAKDAEIEQLRIHYKQMKADLQAKDCELQKALKCEQRLEKDEDLIGQFAAAKQIAIRAVLDEEQKKRNLLVDEYEQKMEKMKFELEKQFTSKEEQLNICWSESQEQMRLAVEEREKMQKIAHDEETSRLKVELEALRIVSITISELKSRLEIKETELTSLEVEKKQLLELNADVEKRYASDLAEAVRESRLGLEKEHEKIMDEMRESCDCKLAELQGVVDQLSSNIFNLNEENLLSRRQIDQQRSQIGKLEEENVKLEKMIHLDKENYEQTNERCLLEIQNQNHTIGELKAKCEMLENTQSAVEREKQRLEELLLKARDDDDSTTSEIASLQADVSSLKHQLGVCQTKLDASTDLLQVKEVELSEYADRMQQLTESLSKKLHERDAELEKLRAELRLSTELVESDQLHADDDNADAVVQKDLGDKVEKLKLWLERVSKSESEFCDLFNSALNGQRRILQWLLERCEVPASRFAQVEYLETSLKAAVCRCSNTANRLSGLCQRDAFIANDFDDIDNFAGVKQEAEVYFNETATLCLLCVQSSFQQYAVEVHRLQDETDTLKRHCETLTTNKISLEDEVAQLSEDVDNSPGSRGAILDWIANLVTILHQHCTETFNLKIDRYAEPPLDKSVEELLNRAEMDRQKFVNTLQLLESGLATDDGCEFSPKSVQSFRDGCEEFFRSLQRSILDFVANWNQTVLEKSRLSDQLNQEANNCEAMVNELELLKTERDRLAIELDKLCHQRQKLNDPIWRWLSTLRQDLQANEPLISRIDVDHDVDDGHHEQKRTNLYSLLFRCVDEISASLDSDCDHSNEEVVKDCSRLENHTPPSSSSVLISLCSMHKALIGCCVEQMRRAESARADLREKLFALTKSATATTALEKRLVESRQMVQKFQRELVTTDRMYQQMLEDFDSKLHSNQQRLFQLLANGGALLDSVGKWNLLTTSTSSGSYVTASAGEALSSQSNVSLMDMSHVNCQMEDNFTQTDFHDTIADLHMKIADLETTLAENNNEMDQLRAQVSDWNSWNDDIGVDVEHDDTNHHYHSGALQSTTIADIDELPSELELRVADLQSELEKKSQELNQLKNSYFSLQQEKQQQTVNREPFQSISLDDDHSSSEVVKENNNNNNNIVKFEGKMPSSTDVPSVCNSMQQFAVADHTNSMILMKESTAKSFYSVGNEFQLQRNRFDSADSHPLFAEPTEAEYLKNILFRYMVQRESLGKECVTLAKAIAAVVKFSPMQTKEILTKEESRNNRYNCNNSGATN